MTRIPIGINVYEAAIARLCEQYQAGHRVVVSFSTGKDSGVCLELAVIAATLCDRLPVEAVLRDEEILLPGSFEYAERVAQRDDVDLHWLVANQPIVNVFNREQPYWWVFDPQLRPDEWVREPPDYCERITDINIEAMTTKQRFPIAEEQGQHLVAVIGLRVQESRGRLYGLMSSGGYMTKPDHRTGVYGCRPIYDWTDGDIWKAILDNGWDYNTAYDVMHRHGISRAKLRIGPPSMSIFGIPELKVASQAWPQWWDKVCTRLPGMRSAARYGMKAVTAQRRIGETWESCFWRECVEEAPAWIAARAADYGKRLPRMHRRHSTAPFPEVQPCHTCEGNAGSWKALTSIFYTGDPFSMRARHLPYVEPEFFRAGAGQWNGSPG